MKIELRPWRLADAPALAGLINNKKVQDNLRDGLPFPYTTAHAEQFLAQMLNACPNDVFARAIVAEGAVVGSLTAERQKNIHRYTAELGYYIGEPYWGRGITTAAVRAACAWLFANTDLVRLYAEPFARNRASCRVLEKAGFTLEGRLRQNAVKNGKSEDMMLYSLLREEWGRQA